jgi:hypothetical protein
VEGPHLKNLLLAGPPGCGKTIAIRCLAGRLADMRLAGFHTQEPREQGQRVGFEAVSLSGRISRSAHGFSPVCRTCTSNFTPWAYPQMRSTVDSTCRERDGTTRTGRSGSGTRAGRPAVGFTCT